MTPKPLGERTGVAAWGGFRQTSMVSWGPLGQTALLFVKPGEDGRWSCCGDEFSSLLLLYPPLPLFLMWSSKQGYNPGGHHLPQLGSCLDQSLMKCRCPSSAEAVAMVAGRWPVSHPSSEPGEGGQGIEAQMWWHLQEDGKEDLGSHLPTTYTSLICSHLLTDHPSCVIHCSRCSDAPWVTILNKTPSIWSQSVFTQDAQA